MEKEQVHVVDSSETEEPDKYPYGFCVIGHGTRMEQKLKIESYVQGHFVDNRLATIALLEDGTYLLSLENPTSTGRQPTNTIRLSKESLVGIFTSIMIFFNCKREDFLSLIEESIRGKDIEYSMTENLEPFTKEETNTKQNNEQNSIASH